MSMEQILEKARELGEMLAQSEEFTELGQLEEAAMADPDIEALYAQFADIREKQETLEMAEEADGVAADNLQRELDELEEQLSQRPEIKSLESARARFGMLMDQVNRVLQITLEGGEADSCGEGGCAGCQGCSVR